MLRMDGGGLDLRMALGLVKTMSLDLEWFRWRLHLRAQNIDVIKFCIRVGDIGSSHLRI